MNIIDELSWRGAVNQMTDEEGLRKLTEEKSISLYCGVDPTGDSMHIGHLIPFMMLKRFANAGHHPFVVIGGGTGTIGDPSGRKTERQLQTLDTIKNNAEKLKASSRTSSVIQRISPLLITTTGSAKSASWNSSATTANCSASTSCSARKSLPAAWKRAFPLLNFLTRSSSPSTLNTSFQRTTSSFRSAVPISGGTLRPGSIRSARCMAAKLKPLA